MKVFKLAAGLAIGYVLGSRAGRDKYDQIVAATRKAQGHPTVTQAQQKAKELLGSDGTASATGDDPAPVAVTTPSSAPAPRPPRRRPTTTTTTTPTATVPAVDPLA